MHGLSVVVGLGVDALVVVSGFLVVGASLAAEHRLWSAQASPVSGFLVVGASLAAEHRLWSAQASPLMAHGLSGCGARAYLSLDMWNLPRSGTEPICPALTGRFLTPGPQRSPISTFIFLIYVSLE